MSSSDIASTLQYCAIAVASVALVRQFRKPALWPGQVIARVMNMSHRGLTRWGLGHLTLARDSVVLDVGCGGGSTIRHLAALALDGKVFGIDYSRASVAVARRTNAPAIESGRVDIRHGSVSSLPYADESFDAVTAVETHYYWPNLEKDLREIRRVLRPGGRVAIIAESYRRGHFVSADVLAMRLLGATLLSALEHKEVLEAAGFAGVEVFENSQKGWICAVGVR
jgi:SAM-dependent methyltransferase